MDVQKSRKLVIVGDSAFAEIAFEYFTHDSPYEVAAFAVEQPFLKKNRLFDRPVIAIDELPSAYSSEEHEVFVAVAYSQMNRLRTRLLMDLLKLGYRAASYVSSKAFVWRNAVLGSHCFIMENNVVQPFVSIGQNVILWSGNHIGHHSTIEDNVFISSHVVISGFCNIGANSFLGVNATVANNVTVGRDCWISSGVTLMKNTGDDRVYPSDGTEPSKASALRLNRVRPSK